jgi:hypothetical protein
MSTRPDDECPYPRPFPPGFRDCPAYRSARLIALDSRYRPLPPSRTCQHLDVGSTATSGRYYARCAVGTAADRARWGGPQRERLLADAEAVTAALERHTGGLSDELWAAKGRQLRAIQADDAVEREQATAELQRIADAMLAGLGEALDAEQERLERLSLPKDTTIAFLRAVIDRFVQQSSAEPVAIPDEWVERFPEQAWWLLRPRAAVR